MSPGVTGHDLVRSGEIRTASVFLANLPGSPAACRATQHHPICTICEGYLRLRVWIGAPLQPTALERSLPSSKNIKQAVLGQQFQASHCHIAPNN